MHIIQASLIDDIEHYRVVNDDCESSVLLLEDSIMGLNTNIKSIYEQRKTTIKHNYGENTTTPYKRRRAPNPTQFWDYELK